MHTSRAALNRLLDEKDTSLTLTTLASAAAVLLGQDIEGGIGGGLKIQAGLIAVVFNATNLDLTLGLAPLHAGSSGRTFRCQLCKRG